MSASRSNSSYKVQQQAVLVEICTYAWSRLACEHSHADGRKCNPPRDASSSSGIPAPATCSPHQRRPNWSLSIEGRQAWLGLEHIMLWALDIWFPDKRYKSATATREPAGAPDDVTICGIDVWIVVHVFLSWTSKIPKLGKQWTVQIVFASVVREQLSDDDDHSFIQVRWRGETQRQCSLRRPSEPSWIYHQARVTRRAIKRKHEEL